MPDYVIGHVQRKTVVCTMLKPPETQQRVTSAAATSFVNPNRSRAIGGILRITNGQF
jgi:hypothetical protein